MRVLIAFGSKRGGTAGLADMIGDALRAAGCETVVSPATGIAAACSWLIEAGFFATTADGAVANSA